MRFYNTPQGAGVIILIKYYAGKLCVAPPFPSSYASWLFKFMLIAMHISILPLDVYYYRTKPPTKIPLIYFVSIGQYTSIYIYICYIPALTAGLNMSIVNYFCDQKLLQIVMT